MSMIKVENLTFAYEESYDRIFENVSFLIDTDWKLGFVGRNGRGKTTFFKLLLGQFEYEGKISSSVQFDYFPYFVEDPGKITEEILHEICPAAEEWEIMRELSYLEVDVTVLWRTFDTLSSGEQTKVLLAALFLNEGHFLLIDEPTNHLDERARQMVAAYLKRKKSFILVSHDRSFLDGCIDHVLSLNKTNIEVQNGNYSSWALNFQRQQEFEAAQNRHLKKEISRLRNASKRNEDWSGRVEASKYGSGPVDRGYIGHKAAKMMKRSRSISGRQQKAIEQKASLLKNEETISDLKIFPLSYHKDVLASLSEVVICYGKNKVNEPVSFDICQGERLAISGKNGSGKSSILKLFMKEAIEHTGTIDVGNGLIISYVSQNTTHLKGMLSDFAAENKIDESLFKAILRKMDFERIQFEKEIRTFSDGQKKKVLLAKSLCEKAHLYIWDEPLNYIDIYSRIQIEQLIEKFSPTMLFVEHDKTFTERIATKKIHLM